MNNLFTSLPFSLSFQSYLQQAELNCILLPAAKSPNLFNYNKNISSLGYIIKTSLRISMVTAMASALGNTVFLNNHLLLSNTFFITIKLQELVPTGIAIAFHTVGRSIFRAIPVIDNLFKCIRTTDQDYICIYPLAQQRHFQKFMLQLFLDWCKKRYSARLLGKALLVTAKHQKQPKFLLI